MEGLYRSMTDGELLRERVHITRQMGELMLKLSELDSIRMERTPEDQTAVIIPFPTQRTPDNAG